MVLTVSDPLLLLNGPWNNRLHSSLAGPFSLSQLLYLYRPVRSVTAGVFMCVSSLFNTVCVWPAFHHEELQYFTWVNLPLMTLLWLHLHVGLFICSLQLTST